MPTRQRTRTQDREYRTNAERARNATQLALAHTSAEPSGPVRYFDPDNRATPSDPDPPPF